MRAARLGHAIHGIRTSPAQQLGRTGRGSAGRAGRRADVAESAGDAAGVSGQREHARPQWRRRRRPATRRPAWLRTDSAGKCYHGNYTFLCRRHQQDKPGFPDTTWRVPAASRADELRAGDHRRALRDWQRHGRDKALMALLDARRDGRVHHRRHRQHGRCDRRRQGVVAGIVAAQTSDPDLKPTNWVVGRFGDPISDRRS